MGGRGGGIYSSGNLTLLNTSVSNNSTVGRSATDTTTSADGWGGGGYFVSGDTLISNCFFAVNFAGGGQGLYGQFPSIAQPGGAGLGASVYLEGGRLVVASTTFTQNLAVGGEGGGGGFGDGGRNGGDAGGAGIFMSNGILILSNATFVGNYAAGGSGGAGYLAGGGGGNAMGAGIAIRNGQAILTGSTLNNNTSRAGANASGFRLGNGIPGQGLGGGIYSENGALVFTNCTLSRNLAIGGDDLDHVPGGLGSGGAVYAWAVPIDMITCTVASNAIVLRYYLDFGGGIHTSSSTFRILNSIVVGNLATTNGTNVTVASDIYGTISSLGHNLVGDTNGASGFVASDLLNVDANLGPLQDNGGTTFTHALLPGSAAIDAGSNTGAPGFDQRGFPRPAGTSCDIGAYEFTGPSAVTLSGGDNAQIQFLVWTNQTYPIQATTDFSNWQTIGTVPTSPTGQFMFEDSANLPKRFYRLVLSP